MPQQKVDGSREDLTERSQARDPWGSDVVHELCDQQGQDGDCLLLSLCLGSCLLDFADYNRWLNCLAHGLDVFQGHFQLHDKIKLPVGVPRCKAYEHMVYNKLRRSDYSSEKIIMNKTLDDLNIENDQKIISEEKYYETEVIK
ncbi:hypothetical protein llap_3470 [Limosa lapponica baueri]|uniref:Uncharacterized protein n=1 Tax=Limosa lapponica baueri TaxID=1758121 RepID=A0A2I0UJM9_LIMLA|nr:hypothetical protein llap_3470 [Limosa lapponica baueri]